MLKKIIPLVLLCSLIWVGCSDGKPKIDLENGTFSEFPKNTKTTFSNLVEYKKGTPSVYHMVDDQLIIFNSGSPEDKFLYNYSLTDGTLSDGYLSRGRGPGEIFGSISSGITGNSFWFHDFMLKKIVIFNKDEAAAYKKGDTLDFVQHPAKEFYYSISFLDSLTYLGTGAKHTKPKFQEVDLATSDIKNEFGTFENIPDESDMPYFAFKTAHESFTYVSPSGDKVALFYRFTDLMEIYDLTTKEKVSMQGPLNFKPVYKPFDGGGGTYAIIRTEDTRFGFVHGVVTDKYVYGLFSGKLDGDKSPSYGSQLFVYDWDGKPVKKIDLDREVSSFGVSNDDTTIYSYDPLTGFLIKGTL